MKKLLSITVALVLALSFCLTACGKDNKKPGGTKQEITLRVRSDLEQSIKVGEVPTKIIYTISPSTEKVEFVSSDTGVLTVDEYGDVSGVGVGQATVTLSVKDHPEVNPVVINFDVSRNFFRHDSGYFNGNADFSKEDENKVTITGGQTQMLADYPGQTWYFKATLKYNGTAPGSFGSGSIGVGSFLVDIGHPIGDTMFWSIIWPASGQVAYGGWRYESGANGVSVDVDGSKVDPAKPYTMTIMRHGIRHYMIVTQKDAADVEQVIAKYIYDVPFFEGEDTYPGVYGQEQNVEVYDFEGSNVPEEVYKHLSDFQKPESISMNFLTDKLYAGETYNVNSLVLPDSVFDKSASYYLDTPVEGVTLTKEGVLTISEGATGSIKIKAVANADNSVTDERTLTISAKGQSTSQLFDTVKTVGTGVSFGADSLTINGNGNYVPFMHTSEKWYLSFSVQNNADAAGSKIGVMSAKNGFTDYTKWGIVYGANNTTGHKAEIGTLNEVKSIVYGAENADNVYTVGQTHTLGMLKDGEYIYIFADGKLMKSYKDVTDGATYPAIYSDGATASITNISLTTDAEAVDAVLQAHPFYVGGYVTMTEDEEGNPVYKLANLWQGNKGDIDWPPVNEYINGIVMRDSLTGDYTMEFTMSNLEFVTGVGNDGKNIDAKVLIYMRSESKSSSLQFVYTKGIAPKAPIKAAFVPNFGDVTFTEYEWPAGYTYDDKFWDNEVSVKVVKTYDLVELYLNGNRIFEGSSFMENHGEWGTKTICTPGIGTFACGMTISNVKITSNN